ncbi:MAG: Grx4 family monothiol glutaredoxin [Deltaproteobacteria bacterium]|nr:Grx4 family monothiol glutaredoxin [Deltaproteobacteria bacterium]
MNVEQKIKETLEKNPVVLYMKGTAEAPQCGFSMATVQVLKQYGMSFKTINVLEDHEIREGIKKFSNWPTIPQLYVKGKFIGGCDIVTELHENGELEQILKSKA